MIKPFLKKFHWLLVSNLRTSFAILTMNIVVMIYFILLTSSTFAGNSSYISLSNQIARKTELDIVSNNVANLNTIGYEADEVLFKSIESKQSSNRSVSFVQLNSTYKKQHDHSLINTGNPKDLAIAGDGYFKILTPRGDRYTLNGTVLINRDGVLVNADGYPFASQGNQPIIVPIDATSVTFMRDGSVYAEEEIIDFIGVFTIENKNQLVKEGNSLYRSVAGDLPTDPLEVEIIVGALRASNVNSVLSMTQLMELQRSYDTATNMIYEHNNLEKTTINKLTSE